MKTGVVLKEKEKPVIFKIPKGYIDYPPPQPINYETFTKNAVVSFGTVTKRLKSCESPAVTTPSQSSTSPHPITLLLCRHTR